MTSFLSWLRENKFEAHLTAFSLMILSSVGMIIYLRSDASGWFGLPLSLFVLGNLLAMLIT
jgi:hypothetical protein